MFSWIKNIFSFYVERYKKRFIYCFVIYYLLVFIGGLIGVLNHGLTSKVIKIVGSGFTSFTPGLFQAIDAGQAITIILMIFVINSIFGTFLLITLPNIICLGTLTFIFRPLLWGIIYAPINPQETILLVSAIPTMIIEGLAYIIAFVASIDLFLAILNPVKLDEDSRFKALKKAALYNLKSYVLVLMVLFIAAIVETVTILLIS